METETINTPQEAPVKKSIIRSIANLPQHICCHLFGENHPIRHRIIIGLIICGAGVTLSMLKVESYFLKVCCETSGISLHGIGLSPLIERMAKK